MELLLVFAGMVAGFCVAWFAGRARAAALGERAVHLRESLEREQVQHGVVRDHLARATYELAETRAALAHERRASDEKLAVVDRARRELTDTFAALSANALEANRARFIDMAKATFEAGHDATKSSLKNQEKAVQRLIEPIKESLDAVDGHVRGLEAARQEAYGALREQVASLTDTHRSLQLETGQLVRALRTPQVRGRWGEMQLHRVVEIAGMIEHCDFVEQPSIDSDDGTLRPDMIVSLPGNKQVVIDAKTPLQAYLDSLETDDDTVRHRNLEQHARQVRSHMSALGAKSYWGQFQSSPEFVVMFLPGESFFSAALQIDPQLIESGAAAQVLIATPTTLIALLRSISYGWRQERVAENAQVMSDLGRTLFKRLQSFSGHVAGVGKGLERAISAYNQAVGSLENRVFVTARQFAELGAVADDALPVPRHVDTVARELRTDGGESDGEKATIDLRRARAES